MDLITLMYKYINRFINSDELLKSLEELDLNKFSNEEKVSINKLIEDKRKLKMVVNYMKVSIFYLQKMT